MSSMETHKPITSAQNVISTYFSLISCLTVCRELQSVKETPKKRRMHSTPEERAQSRARLEELIKELKTLNESIPEPTVVGEVKEEKVEEPEAPKQVK